jgi:hypothetical protein
MMRWPEAFVLASLVWAGAFAIYAVCRYGLSNPRRSGPVVTLPPGVTNLAPGEIDKRRSAFHRSHDGPRQAAP